MPTPTPGTVAAPAPGAVLSESFDQGVARGWELEPGWQVAQYGAGQFGLHGVGHVWASHTAGTWSNFTLALKLNLARGGIHINYRTAGPQRYFIGFRQGGIYLMKQTGPQQFSGELARAQNPRGLTPRQWHNVTVTGNGGQISVTVDGATALTYTDPNPITQGGIAFETLDDSDAWIDDVVVSLGAAPAPALMQMAPLVQPGVVLPQPGLVAPQPGLMVTQPGTVGIQPAGAALSESFDRGPAQGWELAPGWHVAQYGAGQFGLHGVGHVWASYTAGTWSDFTLALKLNLARGGIHINYRTNGPQRYFIGFHENAIYLMKQTGPQQFSGDLARRQNPPGWTPNQWHNVAVTGNGGQLTVTADGVAVLTYTDPNPIAQGGIAFETLEDSDAWIDDVAVTPLR
jgi:hypothetical protein